MASVLNNSVIKSTAQTVAAALEYPDWMLTSIGPFMYNTLNGKVFYDAFEKFITFALTPQNVASLRTWYSGLIHPIHKGWALADDPISVLFWLAFYIVMLIILAFVGKATAYPGRLEMKTFSMIHNLILFLLSLYMGVSILANLLAEPVIDNVFDMPASKSKAFAKACWLFTLSKIPEFIDTFIMVLKQNYHQVSFLHVYHHMSVLIFCIGFTGTVPGGCSAHSSLMNSFVHVFMYFYYFSASFAGKTGPLRDFLNSIKFIITKGQMTQFALNFVHALYLYWLGESSRFAGKTQHAFWMVLYMTTMLGLFGNFLIQGQRAAARERKQKKLAEEKKKSQ